MKLPRLGGRPDLTRPGRGGLLFSSHFDPGAFGRFSEGIARFLGTGRFLAGQTVVVAMWIGVNAVAVKLRWDPYPFILLNLAFSTQAAYAAPLILLAQNRQDERDRAQAERDREVTQRTRAEAEFLARELASVRISLTDVVTGSQLDDALETLTAAIDKLNDKIDVFTESQAIGSGTGPAEGMGPMPGDDGDGPSR